MKYLKLFESERPFRELDLQQLYDDLIQYGGRLIKSNYAHKAIELDVYFQNRVLNSFLDKHIEFHRIVNPFDQEVSYTFKGKVSRIEMHDEHTQYALIKNVVVSLYKDEKLRNFSDDLKYKLGKIYLNPTFKKPQIIKVYDCGFIPYEEDVEQLKMEDDAKRYNL